MFNKLNINNYFYDVFIRYSDISLITIFLFNISHYNFKYKTKRRVKNKLNNIAYIETYLKKKLPIYSNIHLDHSMLFMRKLHLLVGKSSDIFTINTFLGIGNNFLKHYGNRNFFNTTTFFLNTDNYLFNSKNNLILKNIYLFTNLNLNNDYINSFLINNNSSARINDTNFHPFHILNAGSKNNSLYFNNNYLSPININKRLIHFVRIKRKYYNFFYRLKKKNLSNLVASLRSMNTIEKVKYHELRLSNVIKNIFLISKIDSINFISKKYIFLNGKVCKNLNIILKKNDRVQLCINKNIFLYQRLYYSILIKKYFNTLRYFNKKWRVSIFNEKIFLNLTDNFFDIPKYIEVDYVIMTLFIIYIPMNIVEYNTYNLYYKNILKFNLLNWKLLY